MTAITRTAGACIVVAGAVIVPAAPASADVGGGPYTVTYIDGGGAFKAGDTAHWNFSPCGPDCIHVNTGGKFNMDLHREGGAWNGPWGPGNSCTASLDDGSLLLTEMCPNYPNLTAQLSKG